MIFFIAISCAGVLHSSSAQIDEDATHLLQTRIVQSHASESNGPCWTQKDGYYILEQHGDGNPECYSTLEAAKAKCDAAGDCGAVAYQSTIGDNCFRVTHGGPTLSAYWTQWQSYNARSWVIDGQGCTTTTTTTTKAPTSGCGAQPWTQKDGYYILEQHGDGNPECYSTLEAAKANCDAAGDCGAVAYQSTIGDRCYRVTHGGPTLSAYWAQWQSYNARSWVREGPPCTKPAPTTTTTTSTTVAPPSPPSPSPGVIEDGVCHGTEDISEGTDEYDSPCFDADTGFGPDFSCATTEMWCGDDSGDGLVVGQCCPKKCKAECENKNKKKNEEGRKKAERERKEKRKANEESRKKAEKERKRKKKQDEWQRKRDTQKEKNEKAEDERKGKKNWDEKKRKNERKWKNGLKDRKEKANKREKTRKSERGNKESKNKNANNNNQAERDNKAGLVSGEKKRKENRKKKKDKNQERKQKKKQNKGRKGRKGRKGTKGRK